MNNRRYPGGTWNYTNSTGATIESGSVVDFGTQIGIASEDIEDGEVGAIDVDGIFELSKNENLVISQGDLVYWNSTDTEIDKTAVGQTYAGICAESATLTATLVLVEINRPTRDIAGT